MSLVTILVVGAVWSTATAAQANSLELLSGRSWCLSSISVADCGRARGFPNPHAKGAIALDGRSIYLPGGWAASLGVLQADLSNGAIRQEPGAPGCVASAKEARRSRARSCAVVAGFAGPAQDVVVSADGRNVYIATADDDRLVSSVIVFSRGPDGRLTRLPGPDGCVASVVLDDCALEPELTAHELSLTPDDAQVYAGDGPTLSVFSRDAQSGALTAADCWSTLDAPSCETSEFGLGAPVWSRDGRHGFAIGGAASLVIGFSRDPVSGTVTRVPGACVSALRVRGCTRETRFSRGANFITEIVVAPDNTLYVAAVPTSFDIPWTPGTPFAIVGFRISKQTGALIALRSGCLHTQRVRGCRQDPRLPDMHALVFSRTARRLYASSSNQVLEFTRDRKSGQLRRSSTVHTCLAPGPCARGQAPIGLETGLLMAPDNPYLYAIGDRDYHARNGTIVTLTTRPH